MFLGAAFDLLCTALIFFGKIWVNFLGMYGDLGIYWELFRDFVEFLYIFLILRGVLVILGDLLRYIMIFGSFLDFVGFSGYFEVFWEKIPRNAPKYVFLKKIVQGDKFLKKIIRGDKFF